MQKSPESTADEEIVEWCPKRNVTRNETSHKTKNTVDQHSFLNNFNYSLTAPFDNIIILDNDAMADDIPAISSRG